MKEITLERNPIHVSNVGKHIPFTVLHEPRYKLNVLKKEVSTKCHSS
jgi:hypothetical protein